MNDNQILAACDRAVRGSEPLQSQTNPLHRILEVEDDVSIRQLNIERLRHSGYEVDAAAWQALSNHTDVARGSIDFVRD